MAYEDNGLRDHLLDHITDYITANGGGLGKKTGRQMIRCILPGHNDSGPSFCYYPATRSFYCFGCRRGGNLIDLIGHMEGLGGREAYKKAIEIYGHLYPGLDNARAIISPSKPLKSEKGITTQKPAAKPSRGISEGLEAISEEEAVTTAQAEEKAKADMAIARKNVEEGRAAEAKAYLEGRGLNYDHAVAWGIGYKDGRVYYPGPYPGGYFLIKKTTRNAKPKALITKDTKPAPLNASLLEDPDTEYIFIVEGPEDLLSIEQYGHPAIAISTSLIQKVFEQIDRGHYYKDPNRFFIVSMDPDQAGRTASADLVKGLRERGIKAVAVDISGGHDDPNDNLKLAGEDTFRNTLAEALETAAATATAQEEGAPLDGSEPVAPEDPQIEERLSHEANRASERLPALLEKANDKTREPGLSTGLTTLDQALGGIYPGLYILGAEPSTGKTTLALQIADHIAAGGKDILFFTTEMAPETLIARSLSRHSFKAGEGRNGLSAREILNGYKLDYVGNEKGETVKVITDYSLEETKNLDTAIAEYGKYSPRIYYIDQEEGLTYKTITDTVNRHIELEGGSPFIVLDYIQMLNPHDPRLDFRLNLDAAIKGLKRLCNGKGLSVLAISSFNRAVYGTDAKMSAYKETSQIEYQAEVLLALQPRGAGLNEDGTEKDMEDHRLQTIRDLEIKILKARDGETGALVNLSYQAKYNTFEDDGLGVRVGKNGNKKQGNPSKYRKNAYSEVKV